jgi:hypothetical protein
MTTYYNHPEHSTVFKIIVKIVIEIYMPKIGHLPLGMAMACHIQAEG